MTTTNEPVGDASEVEGHSSFPTLPFTIKTATPVEAREKLEEIFGANRNDPSKPDRLKLTKVVEVAAVFQIRGPDGTNEKHISELMDALMKSVGDLHPITVWRCGASAVLIDGHHRLMAYRRLAKKNERYQTIPVKWFDGTVLEAMEEAAKANTEIKLSLTAHQRNDFAWILVLHGIHSKAQIVKMSSTSEGTVAKMRRIKRKMEDVGYPLPNKWKDAMRWDKGQGEPSMSYEDYPEMQANVWADAMAKTFSTAMAKSPLIAARALEIYFGGKLKSLIEAIDEVVDFEKYEAGEQDELDAQCPF